MILNYFKTTFCRFMYFNHLKGSTVDSVLVKPECEKYLSKETELPFSKEQDLIKIKLDNKR